MSYFDQIGTLIRVQNKLGDEDDLHLGGNEISNIDALKGLTKLNYLYLYTNEITNIEALRGLTNLQQLQLAYNQITDYSPISSYYNNLTGIDFTLK